MDNFWNRVKELINLKRLTQIKVELDLGLNPSFISQSTTRNTIPRADVALKMADYFGVTLKWLVTGEDEMGLDPKLMSIMTNHELMELAFEISLCSDRAVKIINQIVGYDREVNKR